MKPHALLPLLVILAACGTGPVRYEVPPVELGDRRAIRFSSVEVMDVSLPAAAASETILVRGRTGGLIEDPEAIWADDPARAMTLELVRHIGTITGSKVASEPWPFREPAQARLEVRVETLAASPSGNLTITGQYFVAPDSGLGDRARRFSLAETWQPDSGTAALAAARGRIVARLAQTIVASGLR